jgi:hypothetical protein
VGERKILFGCDPLAKLLENGQARVLEVGGNGCESVRLGLNWTELGEEAKKLARRDCAVTGALSFRQRMSFSR